MVRYLTIYDLFRVCVCSSICPYREEKYIIHTFTIVSSSFWKQDKEKLQGYIFYCGFSVQ